MPRVLRALGASIAYMAHAKGATVIPAAYEAGHFFATPRTVDGQALRILMDTGAGGTNYWLSKAAVDRLKLKPSQCAEPQDYVGAPAYLPEATMPSPVAHCGDVLVVNEHVASVDGVADGIAGGAYLDGRLWTFDYPARQLRIEHASWKASRAAHALPLGLERSPGGGLAAAYPRVSISVGGESIDVLLDTGATSIPTEDGEAAMHAPLVHGEGTTSYITTSIMDRWHAAHPDWRVVAKADKLISGMRVIEVPTVDIAGWRVGPVWFTERPDKNFGEQGMSRYMDRTVYGAAGANILDAFVLTLDYASARAWLACPEPDRCRPAITHGPKALLVK